MVVKSDLFEEKKEDEMKTFTWDELKQHSCSLKAFLGNEDLLRNVKEGKDFLIFLAPSPERLLTKQYTSGCSESVELFRKHSRFEPFQLCIGSCLDSDRYFKEWIIVPSNIFKEEPVKIFTWSELEEYSLPVDYFVKNKDNLEKVGMGKDFLLYKIHTGVDKKAPEYTKNNSMVVKKYDEYDKHSPIQCEAWSEWLETERYRKDWVIVQSNIFDEKETPAEKQKETTEIKKENEMTTQNTRRTVRIELFDNDKGLDVQHSLVASYPNVLTEDTDAVTIQEIIMSKDIAGKLRKHNEIRTAQVDLDILKRTGNAVNLQPVKLKNLTWVVKQ